MDLQQTKFEISKKLTFLKKMLQVSDFALENSIEDDEIFLNFHGYSTPEVFENDLLFDHFEQLNEWINLCYLNELDENKRTALVESIIERLSFENRYTGLSYDYHISQLDEAKKKILNQFELIQIKAKDYITESLKSNYLSQINLDIKKIARIEWKGNQNQLAELFYKLEDCNWIGTGTNKSAYYRTLATMFYIPDSDKLLKNLKDYFKKDKMPNDAFQKIQSNNIN